MGAATYAPVMTRRVWMVGLAGLALAACGTEEVTSNTGPVATLPPTTTAPAPTSVAATVAPTTLTPLVTTVPPVPATTPAPTTAAPTTVPPAPTVWSSTDLRPRAFVQGYSGNWWGDGDARSPAWPDDPAATPADGFYATTLVQPWAPGDAFLQVRISRLDLCTVLPADTCNLSDDPSEMGADPDRPRDVQVPLDGTTRVVVAGFDCFDMVPTTDPNTTELDDDQNKLATGTALRDLMESYTAEFAAVVQPAIDAGLDLYADPAPFAGGPDDGFLTEAEVCTAGQSSGGPLRYRSGDAPVLLLQSVTDAEGGPLDATELLQTVGVWFAGGSPIYLFSAGFSS